MLTPPLILLPAQRDRRLRQWSGRSGLLLAPKLVDDRSGGTNLAFLRGRPRFRERLVQGLTFVLRQIVPLIIDHQVKLSALGQPRWLVEAQPPVLDTCTQRSHVTTVWRQQAYRQAGTRAVQNSRGTSHGYGYAVFRRASMPRSHSTIWFQLAERRPTTSNIGVRQRFPGSVGTSGSQCPRCTHRSLDGTFPPRAHLVPRQDACLSLVSMVAFPPIQSSRGWISYPCARKAISYRSKLLAVKADS